MIPIPSLRQLRYLEAVVALGHFGHAAEACHVGASALSAGIAELEDLLGVRLLERTRRRVVPTAIGIAVAERARALLRGAEEIAEVALAARAPMSGPLVLGVIPTIGPFLLPRLMPLLREAYPALRLYLVEDQTARLLERLAKGSLDAALIALPFPTEGLASATVGIDGFRLIVPSGHRLARARSIAVADVAPDELLLLEDGHCLRQHALAACGLDPARRSAAFQGTSLHTLVQMVANGLGITLVPDMAVTSGILRGTGLVARPLRTEGAREIGLVWRETSGRGETFRTLAGEISGHLGQASSAHGGVPREPKARRLSNTRL